MIDSPSGFKIGSYVFSRSRFHADDPASPVGGVVIRVYDRHNDETGEIEPCCKVVTVWRGQVRYNTIPLDDIEPDSSNGLLRVDVLKQLAGQLAADEVKRADPFCHDDARRAIHRALIDHGVRP